MSVKLRMQRLGRRNRPFYRVGAFDVHTKRSGKCLEILGHYDPYNQEQPLMKEDRVLHWLQVGAIPTESVKNYIKNLGILAKYREQKADIAKKHTENAKARTAKVARIKPGTKFKKSEGEQAKATNKARRRKQRTAAKAKANVARREKPAKAEA